MAKIKKYIGGLASAASGTGAAAMSNLTGGPASGASSFGTKLDKFGAPILAATSTIANLINANKKQDPTGRPYKNGTSMVKTKNNKLIKYQNAVDSLELKKTVKPPPTQNPDTGTETLFVGYAPPDLEQAKQNILKEGKGKKEEEKEEATSGSTGNKNGYSASQTLRATGGAAAGKALGNYRSKSKKLENTINFLGGALKYGLPLVSVGYNVNQAMPEEEGESFDWSKFGGQTAADLFGIMAGRKTAKIALSPIRKKIEQNKKLKEDVKQFKEKVNKHSENLITWKKELEDAKNADKNMSVAQRKQRLDDFNEGKVKYLHSEQEVLSRKPKKPSPKNIDLPKGIMQLYREILNQEAQKIGNQFGLGFLKNLSVKNEEALVRGTRQKVKSLSEAEKRIQRNTRNTNIATGALLGGAALGSGALIKRAVNNKKEEKKKQKSNK